MHYKLNYDFDTDILSVAIIECKDLPSADEGGASDPYVRIMVLPDTKKRHYETIVINDTLDPYFDQTLVSTIFRTEN